MQSNATRRVRLTSDQVSLLPRFGSVKRLDSLECWKVARRLAGAAYRLTLDSPLSRHYSFADQIRRAAPSIPANIAEGYSLATRPQLVHCLRIALGSATELRTMLPFTVSSAIHALDLDRFAGATLPFQWNSPWAAAPRGAEARVATAATSASVEMRMVIPPGGLRHACRACP